MMTYEALRGAVSTLHALVRREDFVSIPKKTREISRLAQVLNGDIPAQQRVNIYRREFSAICPNNGEVIWYTLVIRSPEIIQAEVIAKETAHHRCGHHEDIADRLHKSLGWDQTLTAHHHGVDIETRRR